jgi:hypothetical protein
MINWTMVAVVAALAGILLIIRSFTGKTDEFKNKIIPEAIKKVVNDPSTKIEVSNVKDTNGVYEFQLKLAGQTYTSYITKDGKILFTSGIKLDAAAKTTAAAPAQKKLTCNDLNKSSSPVLTAYIVANCPYGLQMERTIKNAMNQDPALADKVEIKYIGAITNGQITSMHGDAEAKENLRQICIREEQKSLFWPYLSCYMQAGDTTSCLANVGVDQTMMNACTADASRGLAYAQKDFDAGTKFNVSGSPTLVLNNKQVVSEYDFGGRVPDAIRSVVCCGSSTQDSSCSTPISKNEMAVAFSTTDEAGTTTNTTSNTATGCAPATPAAQ